MSYIYIASPYTHGDEEVVTARATMALIYTCQCFREQKHVFSPIVHCHPVAMIGKLPGSFDYWEKYNIIMIENAHEMHVLKLPYWTESKGVAQEMIIAKVKNIPIHYIDFEHIKYIAEKMQLDESNQWLLDQCDVLGREPHE